MPKQSLRLKRNKTLLVSIMMLLASCQTTTSSAGCPKLVAYTPGEQDILTTELIVLAPNDPLRLAMNDYAQLRAQVRACQEVK